ncbi:MAG TPA: head GIN domain-containing protein [Pedobacter sp.]
MRLLSLAVIAILMLSSSCRFSSKKRITGDGDTKTEQRTAGTFHSVEVTGPFKVHVNQGAATSIEVRADKNLLSYIETENDNGTLEIRTKRGYNLKFKKPVEIFITTSDYRMLSVTGSGEILTGLINAERVEADVTGSGDIFLEVDAPEVRTEITGSGNIRVKGRARTLSSEINGSGELHAFNLLTENTSVDIAGSGDAEVFASKNLEIDIAGAGNIDYKGSPAIKKSVTGSGNIRKAD